MKYLKFAATIAVTIGLILTANFLFRSEFKAGWCIKDVNDGYTWYINNFSFGKYTAMGWQNNAWGNPVKTDKEILERKDSNGIKVYNRSTCPSYKPK